MLTSKSISGFVYYYSGDVMAYLRTRCVIGIGAAILLSLSSAQAAPVNGTGNVVPNMIFGTGGNNNGGYTGEVDNGIEIGLRAKQRYPAANIFNYDGDHTYTFDSRILNTNPANRSVFNFTWSINVEGVANATIGSFDYLLQVDRDPTAGTDFTNPSNSVALYNPAVLKDHSFGTTSTAAAGGLEAANLADYANYLATYTVSQQSWNLGFEGFSADPDLPGMYQVNLFVFEKGTTNILASSSIDINVIPEPGSLALIGMGLAGLAAFRRRKPA